jgi:DHA1 family bicyclomycin/chloramphenicol resistance-like MFS transporter
VFGLAPAVAPVIGGFIHVAFGWRAVFLFMALIGGSLFVASSLRLNETHHHDRRVRFHFTGLAHTTFGIIRHREFVRCALASGLNIAGVLTFIAAAPAIVIDHWHLRETQFAWLFLPLIGGLTFGAAISGKLAGRVRPGHQIGAGFCITMVSMALLVGGYFLDVLTIPMQQFLLAGAGVGLQTTTPSLVLRMLDLYPNARGSAASVQSFCSLSLNAFAMGIAAPALHHSMLALALFAFLGNLIAIWLWLSVRKMTAPHPRVVEA